MANGLDSTVMIEDIRQNDIGPSILDELRHGLHPAAGGEKKLPTLLLYDEKGLKLFEEISYLDAYYLTNTEIEILRNHASDIARKVPNGCMILELGSGYESTLPERANSSPFMTASREPCAAGLVRLMLEQQSAQGRNPLECS